jgi:hypothetical protein
LKSFFGQNGDVMMAAPRVGLFGTFDRQTLSDRLAARVLGRELERRLPGVSVRSFAPTPRSAWWDGGQPAEALGRWSAERRKELADQLDCVVVRADVGVNDTAPVDDAYAGEGGDGARALIEGLGSENAKRCPAVWLTIDRASKERLEAKGVDGFVDVVPDPAVLVPRVFPDELLGKRLEYLRLMGWYPPGNRVLVVQGDGNLADTADIVGRTLGDAMDAEPGLAVVVIEADGWRDDAAFAGALERALPMRLYRLPATVSVEDLVAVIRAGTAFIGSSVGAHGVALAFGRAQIGLDLATSPPLEALGELGVDSVRGVHDGNELEAAVDCALGGLAPSHGASDVATRRLDARLDVIAEVARDSAQARTRGTTGDVHGDVQHRLSELERRLALVEAAHEARGERLVAERLVDADAMWELRQEKARVEDRLVELRADWKASVSRLEAEREADREAYREDARAAHEAAQAALEAEMEAHAATQVELSAVLATRTFRYTAAVRRLYGSLRRRLR